MGEPKQLLQINGESLVRRAVKTLAKVQYKLLPNVLVLGANAEKITAEVQDLPIHCTFNADWQSGMASSIHCGLSFLLTQEPDLEAVIIILIDQPLLQASILDRLIAQFSLQPSKHIVASQYNDTLGVPALFSKSIFEDLLNLNGEAGARKVIQKYLAHSIAIDFAEGAWDIDTPADYARVQALLKD
jgi:molybdenum cofactor cytidylyltransferase